MKEEDRSKNQIPVIGSMKKENRHMMIEDNQILALGQEVSAQWSRNMYRRKSFQSLTKSVRQFSTTFSLTVRKNQKVTTLRVLEVKPIDLQDPDQTLGQILTLDPSNFGIFHCTFAAFNKKP